MNMFSLDLTKEDYQFIYETVRKATMADDYDLVCKHCKLNKVGNNCGNHYCEVLKYKLYRLIETL